ncbi:MAG TPA: hypothetical protein VFA27_05430 [Vicinamibacterales bacterium]|nr:hypothetical protein [Vicinamibacterales bacterium]
MGQTVTAQLVEPVYAYDRVVLPVGTLVQGRITSLTQPSKLSRLRAMAGGDFSPHRAIEIRFESAIRDGRSMLIDTIAKNETPHPSRAVAPPLDAPDDHGTVARATSEARSRVSAALAGVKQRIGETISSVKSPGRLERLKAWAADQLPYRRQILRKGTAYDAELHTSLDLGLATPRPTAPDGTLPPPNAVLKARLQTTLDSRATPRGSAIEAIVSEPVFADDGRLIFPEGTKLSGEVTFATPARRFHRNGQLRFLFEQVELPTTAAIAPMLASLHAADVSADAALALDDEGGAAVKDSKTRFVEPAVALLALRGSFDRGEGGGFEGASGGVRTTAVSARTGGGFARGVSGLIGFGAIGFVVGRVAPPLGIALGVVGTARTVYANVLGKGQEVHFAADTPIEVQLAPGPGGR